MSTSGEALFVFVCVCLGYLSRLKFTVFCFEFHLFNVCLCWVDPCSSVRLFWFRFFIVLCVLSSIFPWDAHAYPPTHIYMYICIFSLILNKYTFIQASLFPTLNTSFCIVCLCHILLIVILCVKAEIGSHRWETVVSSFRKFLCVCVYVCVCLCVSVCVWESVYMCVCVCLFVYIYVYVFISLCVSLLSLCLYAYVCMCVCERVIGECVKQLQRTRNGYFSTSERRFRKVYWENGFGGRMKNSREVNWQKGKRIALCWESILATKWRLIIMCVRIGV